MSSTYESIDDWIARQPWPESMRDLARKVHATRVDRGLNPMTLAQWRHWASSKTVVR